MERVCVSVEERVSDRVHGNNYGDLEAHLAALSSHFLLNLPTFVSMKGIIVLYIYVSFFMLQTRRQPSTASYKPFRTCSISSETLQSCPSSYFFPFL